MGWKSGFGLAWSVGMKVARHERQRQRRAEKQRQKELARGERSRQSIEQVRQYRETVKEPIQVIDWAMLVSSEPPVKPVRLHAEENTAKQKLYNYQPGLIGKLLHLESMQRQRLLRKIELARQADENRYKVASDRYQRSYFAWKENCNLARGVLAGDKVAYFQALRQYKPFGLLESRIKLDFLANGIFNLTIYNLSIKDIPHEEPKVLTSGRLSSKAVSKSKLFELHRAYVCSAVLRIAKGLFAVLPARTAIITVVATTSEWGGPNSRATNPLCSNQEERA
jgi:hypothetical protein